MPLNVEQVIISARLAYTPRDMDRRGWPRCAEREFAGEPSPNNENDENKQPAVLEQTPDVQRANPVRGPRTCCNSPLFTAVSPHSKQDVSTHEGGATAMTVPVSSSACTHLGGGRHARRAFGRRATGVPSDPRWRFFNGSAWRVRRVGCSGLGRQYIQGYHQVPVNMPTTE